MTSTIVDAVQDDGRTRSIDDVGAYFDELGRAVEQVWAGHRNNEEHFPSVAARVLTETPVPPDADAVGVLQFLTTRHRLVRQEEFGFGEPPVTLYRARDFRISALYWLNGTTTIHQHKFSGAFRVLVGSSIHVEYGFRREETINGRLLLGDLRPGGAELLERGDVRPIVSGDAFIHALFHLDRPSVTIVVRTDREDTSTPQFEYFRPGLAFDPFYKDETLIRQLSGLRTMHEFAPQDAFRCAQEMIGSWDFFAGFLLLRHWFAVDRSEWLDELIARFAQVHGAAGEVMRPVFAERRRDHAIKMRRRVIQDSMHRLFLALVLNLPDRAAVDAILVRMFPDQRPGDLLARWVEELAAPELRGISGLHLDTDEVGVVTGALRAGQSDRAISDALHLLGSKVTGTPLLDALLK